MVGYNKNIRPMENHGEITNVKIKMTLTNLISLVKLCMCLHKVNICDTMVYHLFSRSEWERGDPNHLRMDRDGKTNRIYVQNTEQWVQSKISFFLSLSSNGVIIDSAGQTGQGLGPMRTSPVCVFPLKQSGFPMSAWRTSEWLNYWRLFWLLRYTKWSLTKVWWSSSHYIFSSVMFETFSQVF